MDKISVIIPCHNNAGALRRVYTDVLREVKKLPVSYELLFIDNASRDGSSAIPVSYTHLRYSGSDAHELTSVFTFHHLKVDYRNKKKWELMPFDFMELKQLLNDWQTGMQEADDMCIRDRTSSVLGHVISAVSQNNSLTS